MNTFFIILIIIAGLLLLYLFLVAPRIFHRPDRSMLYGVHYAHRGLFDNETDSPENSIPAFKKAVAAGYGIELDVQLSKDGIAVVFHDASLKRMCNVDGNVWEYTFDELQTMRLANSDCKIPTFEEVLKTVNGKVPLIIEYKLDIPETKVCETANSYLQSYTGPYCIECFHPNALIWYKKNRPDIVRGLLCMEYWKEAEYKHNFAYMLQSFMITNFLTRPDFIAYKHSDAGNISRNVCRALGALSVTWTIKSQKQYEKAKTKFDLFIFDSFILK